MNIIHGVKTISDTINFIQTYGVNGIIILSDYGTDAIPLITNMKDTLTQYIATERPKYPKKTRPTMVCMVIDLENGITEYGFSNINYKNNSIIFDDFNDEEKAIDQYLELLTPTYTEKLISEGKIKGTQYASVEEIKDELNNLYYTLKNIDDMAKIAFENGETAFEYTGASEKHYSFVDGRTVANCAEIWAVRNAILKGAKLKNLIFRSQYFGNTTNQFADPCDNCKKTFNNNWVLSDNEIYKPSNKFNISIGDSD